MAGGNLGATSVLSTYFGANLTFTAIFLILSEEAYQRGAVVFAVPICWMLGTFAFTGLYRRMEPYFAHGMTLHQALGSAFESAALQRWASVWTIIAFLGTVALEFYGGIRLLEWAGLPLLWSTTISFALAFVVSAMTVTGGFRGVAWADLWLDVVALAGSLLLGAEIVRHAPPNGTWIPPLKTVATLDNIMFVLAAIVIFVPFQFCTLDSWQRLGAWKNREKSPAGWLIGGAAILSVVYCVPIGLGIVVRSSNVTFGSTSHPLKAFLDQLQLPSGAVGLLFAGFVAAMFSTADELLNCCSLSLLFDTFQLSRTAQVRSESDERKLVLSGQFYTAVFAFAAAGLAAVAIAYERVISDLALAIFSAQVVFIFPLIAILFFPQRSRRLARAAMASMFAGFVVAVILVAAGWVLKEQTLTDGAPVAAFLIAGIRFIPSLCRARQPKAQSTP